MSIFSLGSVQFCFRSEGNGALGLNFLVYVTAIYLGAFSDRYGRAQSSVVCFCGTGFLQGGLDGFFGWR